MIDAEKRQNGQLTTPMSNRDKFTKEIDFCFEDALAEIENRRSIGRRSTMQGRDSSEIRSNKHETSNKNGAAKIEIHKLDYENSSTKNAFNTSRHTVHVKKSSLRNSSADGPRDVVSRGFSRVSLKIVPECSRMSMAP